MRAAIKAVARVFYFLEVWLGRAWLRQRGEIRYELLGECQRCARCCEEPSLRLNPLLFHLKPLRNAVIWWQWYVNRFAAKRSDFETCVITFKCHHFDWRTRRCDSYDTRPGLCRDYPRFLMEQPWPELHDDCGYRALDRNAARLAAALDGVEMSEEERERLKRKLHVLK